MKRLWFYARILLDIGGVLALAFVLFIGYLVFVDGPIDHNEEYGPVAPPPDYQQLVGMGIANPPHWQLVGNWQQQRCNPLSEQYLIRYQREPLLGSMQPEGEAWQRIDHNAGHIQLVLNLLMKSPCRTRISPHDLSDSKALWFRVQDLQWWQGQLSDWTVYIYDPRQNVILIWRKGLPP